MSSIRSSYESILSRIAAAARRAGRSPEDVQLIVVTKLHPVECIRQVVEAGALCLGENRVQELREKAPQLPPHIEWHLIGPLQTNKAKYLPGLISTFHALDRSALVQELENRFSRENTVLPVYLEINIGREPQKSGALPEEASKLMEEMASCPHLKLLGLMAIPPHEDHPEDVRPWFREMRQLSERLRDQGLPLGPGLSMGMTHDFEVAIEEGATCVRIGTAIMGER